MATTMSLTLGDHGPAAGTAAAAELVRAARRHAGVTQVELARRLGTRQSVVSRWERGHDEPRLSTLSRVARACGLAATLRLETDDVDIAQIRQQLVQTPEERLASVVNLSRLRAGAWQVD